MQYSTIVKLLKDYGNCYITDDILEKLDLQQLKKDVGYEITVRKTDFVEEGKVLEVNKNDKNK